MSGQRQPTNLVMMKGKKHLTKAEVEERLDQEVEAPADNVAAPPYLSKKQREEFDGIAAQLVDLKIFSNLDCDALARYLIAKDNFIKYTRMIKRIPNRPEYLEILEKAVSIQDKAFKQCRVAASDLGMTITSRCKLVVPKAEAPPESKWDKFKAVTKNA